MFEKPLAVELAEIALADKSLPTVDDVREMAQWIVNQWRTIDPGQEDLVNPVEDRESSDGIQPMNALGFVPIPPPQKKTP